MKNSSNTTGNRTRDLPTCSTVPQPTALQMAENGRQKKIHILNSFFFIALIGQNPCDFFLCNKDNSPSHLFWHPSESIQ
jgi:hypothetical protein